METRHGYHITPLIEGKIQFGFLKKENNIVQVRNELQARHVPFQPGSNWTSLINKLRKNEGDPKYFMPVTDYDLFLQGDLDRVEEESKVSFARLRKNENIVAICEELTM